MKFFFIIIASVTIIFAQIDTTQKADSIKIPDKKVTGIQPKAPTNWSKIKDLFL